MLKFLDKVLKVIEWIFNVFQICYKELFDLLDTLALIFTYLATLGLTVYMVDNCLQENYLITITCAVCIYTLSHVNQRLRGGK